MIYISLPKTPEVAYSIFGGAGETMTQQEDPGSAQIVYVVCEDSRDADDV